MAKKATKGELFASLIPPSEQQDFHNGKSLPDPADPPPPEPADERVSAFHELDPGGVAFDAIRLYIHSVIPKPRTTFANELWAISCLPSTSGGSRLFTLNCPKIEALFGGIDETGECWFRLNVSDSDLPEALWADLRDRYGLGDDEIGTVEYSHPVTAMVVDARRLAALLADPQVRRAARGFVLRRMCEGGSIYKYASSTALAAELLSADPPATDDVGPGRAQPEDPSATSGLHTPYRPVDPSQADATRGPFEVDPDVLDRGLRGHLQTQEDLASWARSKGFTPLSPGPGEPNFDIAWATSGGEFCVAEVKSLTPANEAVQIRLGLGQVLDYQHTLDRPGRRVRAILAVERRPSSERWSALCARHGVELTWPEAFDNLT